MNTPSESKAVETLCNNCGRDIFDCQCPRPEPVPSTDKVPDWKEMYYAMKDQRNCRDEAIAALTKERDEQKAENARVFKATITAEESISRLRSQLATVTAERDTRDRAFDSVYTELKTRTTERDAHAATVEGLRRQRDSESHKETILRQELRGQISALRARVEELEREKAIECQCMMEERDNALSELAQVRREATVVVQKAYLMGFNASGEGWNGEYPFGDNNRNPEDDPVWRKAREIALSTQNPT